MGQASLGHEVVAHRAGDYLVCSREQSDNERGRGVLSYGRSVLIRQDKEERLPKVRYMGGVTLPTIK